MIHLFSGVSRCCTRSTGGLVAWLKHRYIGRYTIFKFIEKIAGVRRRTRQRSLAATNTHTMLYENEVQCVPYTPAELQLDPSCVR